MIHYNTKNDSFIKLHYVLKEQGIKNNDFFLWINNPDLIHIDPRKVNDLSMEWKIMILNEVKQNIWYYLREIVRIPTGGTEIPFKLHKLNLAAIWCLMNNISIIVQGPRQVGKTTGIAGVYQWFYDFGADNTNMVLYGISEDLLKTNMTRIKDFRNTLPEYLQIGSKRDTDNASMMRKNKENGSYNVISIKATGKSEESARNVGRGKSTACQWYDEFAFIEHVQAQYETAIYGYSTVARVAAANNSPHHICLTTTAGFLDTPHGQWAYKMIRNAAPFSEKMYDMCRWNEYGEAIPIKQEINDYIMNSTGAGNIGMGAFVSIEYMYYDLDVPPNYLEEMRALVDSEDAFRREVLMEWRSTSSDHPLGQERVAKLQTLIKKPIDIKVIDGLYFLNIYRDPEELDWNFPYICGMDVGSNTGSDFTTLVFTDPRNFEVVATMRANHHTIPKFLRSVQYILSEIFPTAILIIERNGVGAPIAQMMEGFLPPSRLYHDEKEKAGINLTKPLRDLLFNEVLKTSVVEEMEKIHDRHIISEIVTLKMKNGRIDHDNGKHDDTLIAYLYTKWFLTFCPNRGQYIDPVLIGCNRNNLYSKDELESIIKKTFADAKESIYDFAIGRTGPKFEPTDTALEKVRKQQAFVHETMNSYGMYSRDPDKVMSSMYDLNQERKKRFYKEVQSYSMLSEDKDRYINEENEDMLDPEEIEKVLKNDEEMNKARSRFKSEGFKTTFY